MDPFWNVANLQHCSKHLHTIFNQLQHTPSPLLTNNFTTNLVYLKTIVNVLSGSILSDHLQLFLTEYAPTIAL